MRNERGFTIISVMIAIVLLSLGVLALSRTGTEVMSVHTSTSARTTALGIARSYLEEVRTLDPDDMQTESAVKVDRTGQVDPAGQYLRSLEVTDEARNLKRLKVVVYYPRGRLPVELETMAFVGVF